MLKNFKNKKFIVMLAVLAGVVSFGVWAGTKTAPIMPGEIVPAFPYHHMEQTMSLPYVEKNTLYLSRVSKDGAEMSRKALAKQVSRLAETNFLTGQYLYQTIEGPKNMESSENVVTWIGDKDGNTRRVYKGAGEVRLSPGGNYIALADGIDEMLKIVNANDGTVRVSLGSAFYPVFSPDGKKIAFFRAKMYAPDDSKGIAVVDLQSGKTLTTYNPDKQEYVPITFTPDSDMLLFTAGNEGSKINLFALPLASGDQEPYLITTGEKKLPYISGYRVSYDTDRDVLYLATTEGKIFIVDVSSGDVTVRDGVVDPMWIEDGLLATRAGSGSQASTTLWKVVDIK